MTFIYQTTKFNPCDKVLLDSYSEDILFTDETEVKEASLLEYISVTIKAINDINNYFKDDIIQSQLRLIGNLLFLIRTKETIKEKILDECYLHKCYKNIILNYEKSCNYEIFTYLFGGLSTLSWNSKFANLDYTNFQLRKIKLFDTAQELLKSSTFKMNEKNIKNSKFLVAYMTILRFLYANSYYEHVRNVYKKLKLQDTLNSQLNQIASLEIDREGKKLLKHVIWNLKMILFNLSDEKHKMVTDGTFLNLFVERFEDVFKNENENGQRHNTKFYFKFKVDRVSNFNFALICLYELFEICSVTEIKEKLIELKILNFINTLIKGCNMLEYVFSLTAFYKVTENTHYQKDIAESFLKNVGLLRKAYVNEINDKINEKDFNLKPICKYSNSEIELGNNDTKFYCKEHDVLHDRDSIMIYYSINKESEDKIRNYIRLFNSTPCLFKCPYNDDTSIEKPKNVCHNRECMYAHGDIELKVWLLMYVYRLTIENLVFIMNVDINCLNKRFEDKMYQFDPYEILEQIIMKHDVSLEVFEAYIQNCDAKLLFKYRNKEKSTYFHLTIEQRKYDIL